MSHRISSHLIAKYNIMSHRQRVIKLNVGGTVYATSSMTLCQYPDSMLARMIEGDVPTETDAEGAIFIDRYEFR